MSSVSIVLVTGVSGYLGAHVVDQLVKEGSRVRGTVRSSKIGETQTSFDVAYGKGKVDVVGIDDLIGGDFTLALQDVDAVIHVASPVSAKNDAESTINGAIEGTVRVIRQGQKAGVKRFSIISSIAALSIPENIKPGMALKDTDWNEATREIALGDQANNRRYVYGASKALAEREAWKFVEEHPDISLTTLNPPYFIGPNAPGQSIKPGNADALSTNLVLYNILLPGTTTKTPVSGFVDVRDVAVALIAGIRTPGRNRLPLAGEWFEIKDAVEYIASARPELKDRLASPTPTGQTEAVIDSSKAVKVLGLKLRSWKETVLDTVDYLFQMEKDWKSKGVDTEILAKTYWRS